jgi:hypothetical protein
MKNDVGTADRIIRITAGLVLLTQGILYGHLWGFIGIVPFLTGAIGWCPLYSIFGISTRGKCSAGQCVTKHEGGTPL